MTAAVTIHFRDAKLTAKCVDSLLADGWSPILVWDNSDDAGASFEALQLRYSTEARVLLLRSPTNLGFGKGMNAGLAALGEYDYAGPVLLVNNDAHVAPGLRVELVAALTSDATPTLVAPRIMQDGREQGWLYYQPWLALVTKRPLPGSFAYLSGCCLFVSRSDNTQPLFDNDFFMYGEDVELSWRARREGGGLILLDHIYVQHEGSASSGQASETYERFLVRSHWLLARKLAPNVMARQLMLALRIPSLVSRGCLRAIRYRSLAPLRALGEIFMWR